MRGAATALALLVALGGAAWAAKTSVAVKGRGTAEVSWNAVEYRDELMAQLAPGLTWRLGKDGPTRLDVRKMALVSPQGGALLPGEQTLNLRYWSDTRWELVVFAEERWNWGEDVTELGVFPASVGRVPDGEERARSLEIAFRTTTRGDPTPVPRPAVTGGAEALTRIFEVPDDVAYPGALREAWAALPLLELQMRFGPHVGTVGFEPVATDTLRGAVPRDGGEALDVRIETLRLPAPEVRSEFLERHEGEIPVGVLFADGLPAAGRVVMVSGSELPMLALRGRSGEDSGVLVEGARVPSRLRKAPDHVRCALEGSALRVTVASWEYVFDLGTALDG